MPAVKATETFQHYQVLRRPDGSLYELGRGAMGVTYKAFDTNLRCDVALKVINALNLESETARARFLREARAAAGLRHRNVASVYHLGNDDQCFFYAMEWVDGLTVEAMVKEYGGGFPVVDSLQIAAQVARALGAAYRQGLIHRDIKPANVMVAREDEDEELLIVKVIDFGLARSAVGSEGSANITMGGFVGTPQYASPEQLEEKELDIRSDIYSLGVTLWYMLAGRPPFTGALGSVFVQQLTKEPPWEQVAHLPEEVRTLLAHMLQKNPAQRPQTPTQLRREIEATLKVLPADAAHVNLLNLPRGHIATDHSSDASRTRPVSGTGGGSEPGASRSGPASGVGPGSRLAERYELVALVGEGSNGRVFRARDLRSDSPVAIKVLHAGVLAQPTERRRIQEAIDQLRQAPHPCLKQVQALAEAGEIRFLVEEWVHGFPLVDVLRSRGQLSVQQALRMLAQVASATDHAQAQRLNRLELGLHQISVGLAVPLAGTEAPVDPALLAKNIESWPAFLLKLDALGIGREPGDSLTWAGDMTLLPQRGSLGRDTQTSIRGFVENTYLFSLGAFVHELLSGAPPPRLPAAAGFEVRYVALPELNEAANSVLRQTLSPNPSFTNGTEFLHALCASCKVVLPAAAFPVAPSKETPASREDGVATEVMGPITGGNAGAVALGAGTQSSLDTVGGVTEARAYEPRALAEERAAAEKRAAEEARLAAEKRAAEEARLAAEKRAAEEARVAAEKHAVEEARLAAEKRAAEEARVTAEKRAAEEARLAAEKRAAEEARLAAEKRAAEEARVTAEKRAAEEARTAAEKRAAEEARIAAEKQAAEKRAAEEHQRIESRKRAAAEARASADRAAEENRRLESHKRAVAEASGAERRRSMAVAIPGAAEAQSGQAFATVPRVESARDSGRSRGPKIALGIGVGAVAASGLFALLWVRAPSTQTDRSTAEHPPAAISATNSPVAVAHPPAAVSTITANGGSGVATPTPDASPIASVAPGATANNAASPAPASVSKTSPSTEQARAASATDMPPSATPPPIDASTPGTQGPLSGMSSPASVAATGPVDTPAPGAASAKGIDALAGPASQIAPAATPSATPSLKTNDAATSDAGKRKALLKRDSAATPTPASPHGTPPPPVRKKDKPPLRDDSKAKHKPAPTPAAHPPTPDDMPGFMR